MPLAAAAMAGFGCEKFADSSILSRFARSAWRSGGHTESTMRILVSNDDGYRAPGLAALAAAMAQLGAVTVVAPDRNRSGASNSLTLDRPIRAALGDNGYTFVDGTPTDCVHLAITGLLDEESDIVVSGINSGANLGDDVLYSGTSGTLTLRMVSAGKVCVC